MGILDKLKAQPRWKHADPTVRLEAVKDLVEEAELAALAESDPDPRVRRAAVARLDSPGVLGRVITLSGQSYAVVGIVSPEFDAEELGPLPDV